MEEFNLLLKSHSEEKARQLLQERYSLSGSQKPFLVLHEGVNDKSSSTGAASSQKKRSNKKRKKSKFSRQLQEFLKNGDRNYELYRPMHTLWNAYISNILGTSKGSAALQPLLSADWHGAEMEVAAATSPGFVGIRGIILWESRGQWLIVTEPQGFKMIPKRGSVVNLFCPDGSRPAIVGDRVLCRSAERTTRKFKPHETGGLAPLLNGLLFR